MNRTRLWGLGVAAVVLPLVLVLSALAISRGVEGSPVVPGLDPASTESPDDRPGREGPGDHSRPSPSPSVDDQSGRCDELEHADDPECLSGPGGGSGSGDSSGSGSGSDDSGPSGTSGSSGSSGSDGSGSNSGPGGGDDSGGDD